MDRSFTGTHKVVLSRSYLDSLDAAIELYEDEIQYANATLNVDGLKLSLSDYLRFYGLPAVLLWLLPAIWHTCF